MGKRVLVAIPIVIIVALAVIFQSWVLVAFAVLLALAVQFEIVRAFNNNGKSIVKYLSYAFAVILAAFFVGFYIVFQKGIDVTIGMPVVVLSVFIVLVMLTFAVCMFSERYQADSIANTIFTLVYPQLFLTMFYMLILANIGNYTSMLIVLLMVFVPAMFSDTFAYFIGMAFGKRKLCPKISPKKTVAGSVGGVIGGAVGAVLITVLFYNFENLVLFAIAGAVLGSISQIGDLSASFIKRSLNIKDFGKILPGHGGIVDRMDSILFCIPIVFIFSAFGLV